MRLTELPPVNLPKELGKIALLKLHNLRTLSSSIAGLHLTEMPTAEEIVAQSKILCQDYVYARLKKKGIIFLKSDINCNYKGTVGRHYSDVSHEIQLLGGELEKMYPELYKSMAKQLNMTMTSELAIKKAFLSVSENLFRKNKITWGRIVALFAIANAFSSDCIQQGHPHFVSVVVDTFSKITAKYLATWIAKQGGWVIIISYYNFIQ